MIFLGGGLQQFSQGPRESECASEREQAHKRERERERERESKIIKQRNTSPTFLDWNGLPPSFSGVQRKKSKNERRKKPAPPAARYIWAFWQLATLSRPARRVFHHLSQQVFWLRPALLSLSYVCPDVILDRWLLTTGESPRITAEWKNYHLGLFLSWPPDQFYFFVWHYNSNKWLHFWSSFWGCFGRTSALKR